MLAMGCAFAIVALGGGILGFVIALRSFNAGLSAMGWQDLPSDSVRCAVCSKPCRNWIEGKSLVHWSMGGYAFCSRECVETCHESNRETQAFLAQLRQQHGGNHP